jgi:ribosomal protein S18 acetylase RimI-like enzyme
VSDRRKGPQGPEALAAAPLGRDARDAIQLDGVTVERITTPDDEVVAALAQLLPQLSPREPPTREELADLVAQPLVWLLVARCQSEIIGTLTLVLHRTPTGLAAWIEDVVVAGAARGRGAGEALVRAAQRVAAGEDAAAVNLTSRPEREAANRLYARLGFVRRETNVYVWRPERMR